MSPLDCAIVVLVATLVALASRLRLRCPGREARVSYLPQPRDGAELGYTHPLGWPVRIVQGLPVAVGPTPDRLCERWSAACCMWGACPAALAEEARRLVSEEETHVFCAPAMWHVGPMDPAKAQQVMRVTWKYTR